MRRAALLCVVGVVLGVLGCTTPRPSGAGASATWGERAQQPWSVTERAPVVQSDEPDADPWNRATPHAERSLFLELAYDIYSNHLTKIDGARCEHYPTCSHYGIQAAREHGAVIGSWLTIDRLLRGTHSSVLRQLPLIQRKEGERHRYFDPVEENDFFL